MEFWVSDQARLAILISFCAVLTSMELVVPLFRYEHGRGRRAVPNLMLAVGVVLTNLALSAATASLSALVLRNSVGLLSGIRSHAWLRLILGVAGLDLFAYVAHLLLHKIPLGWKFHRVHHSELEVDVTTAFRQHPGETLWRVFWQSLGTVVLGLPFWIVTAYVTLSGLNALLEHANVRVGSRLDRWLRLLLVTPNMHKIHHSRQIEETDSNYSNIFSLWDRLCRTYTARTSYQQLRYGLDGFDDPKRQTLIGLVRAPFRT